MSLSLFTATPSALQYFLHGLTPRYSSSYCLGEKQAKSVSDSPISDIIKDRLRGEGQDEASWKKEVERPPGDRSRSLVFEAEISFGASVPGVKTRAVFLIRHRASLKPK